MRSDSDPVHGAFAPSSLLPAAHFVSEDGSQHKDGGHGSLLPMSDTLPAGYPVSQKNPPSHDEGATRDFETRTEKFTLRVSPSEKEAFAARASRLGVTTGAWARAVLLDELDARHDNVDAIIRARSVMPVRPELAQAVEQVRRVGVNLNQVIRKGLPVDDALLREVMTALRDVREMLGDRTSL